MDGKLSQDSIPVLYLHGPLPCDFLGRQIQQLQHRSISWKQASVLGYLTQLTMKALYGIGGVDYPPDLICELKHGTYSVAVPLPDTHLDILDNGAEAIRMDKSASLFWEANV